MNFDQLDKGVFFTRNTYLYIKIAEDKAILFSSGKRIPFHGDEIVNLYDGVLNIKAGYANVHKESKVALDRS